MSADELLYFPHPESGNCSKRLAKRERDLSPVLSGVVNEGLERLGVS